MNFIIPVNGLLKVVKVFDSCIEFTLFDRLVKKSQFTKIWVIFPAYLALQRSPCTHEAARKRENPSRQMSVIGVKLKRKILQFFTLYNLQAKADT